MKTNRWIFAILLASLVWVGCDDDDNPIDRPDLNDTDETFVEMAARSNMAEIKFGELAVTKATDSLVKAFAQQMVTEHTTAQNELKNLADNYDGIEWPNDLDEGHDVIMEQLNGAEGVSFDTMYIRSQVTMHEAAVTTFRNATTSSTDARVKAYANKYLPHIEEHREMADSIHTVVVSKTSVGGTGTGGAGTGSGRGN